MAISDNLALIATAVALSSSLRAGTVAPGDSGLEAATAEELPLGVFWGDLVDEKLDWR